MTSNNADHFDVARPMPARAQATAYVVRSHDDIIIVDAGEPGQSRPIFSALGMLEKPERRLRGILITHAHPDHAGSLADIAAKTGAPVYASKLDQPLIEVGSPGPLPTPKPGWLNRLLYKRFVTGGPSTYPQCRVDHAVTHGDRLPFAGGIEVVGLPGHSAGHVGYHLLAERCIFVGDALFNVGWTKPSLGPWHNDPIAERASLDVLAARDWDLAYVGHGAPVTRPAFDRMMRRLATA